MLRLSFDLHRDDGIGDRARLGLELPGSRGRRLCRGRDEFGVLVEAQRRGIGAPLVLPPIDDGEERLRVLGQIGLQMSRHEASHRRVRTVGCGIGFRCELTELRDLMLKLIVGMGAHPGKLGPGRGEHDDEDRDGEHEHDPRKDPGARGESAILLSRHHRPRRHCRGRRSHHHRRRRSRRHHRPCAGERA